MDAISYSYARNNLAKTMDRVVNDRMALIITRQNAPSVVLISLEDYHALAETAYLLQSPRNAQRLLESIIELEEGRGVERELVE